MFKLFSLIFVLAVFSCSAYRADENVSHNDWPARSVLFDNFQKAEQCIIIYNKTDHAIRKKLLAAVKTINETSDRFHVILKTTEELTDEEFKSNPVYIIGTTDNAFIQKVEGLVPLELNEYSFVFDGIAYKEKDDIVKISFYPNPFNPDMPLTIMIGNDQEAIAELVGRQMAEQWGGFFWDSWGYQVIRGNERTMLGNFSEDPLSLWSMDKKIHWEFDRKGNAVAAGNTIDIYDHGAHASADRINNYLNTTEETITRIGTFAGSKVEGRYTIHIYPSMEIKALMYNSTDQAMVDPENNVHTVISDEYANHTDGYAVIPAIRKVMGTPKLLAMEKGMAVYFTDQWQGRGFRYWGSKLHAAGAFPKLDELFNNDLFEPNSPLVINCMAAMFIDFLIQTRGSAYVLSKYTTWADGEPELLAMQKEWERFVEDNYLFVSEPPKQNIIPPFLKGFNFAHEGYSVYNGYMGTTAMQSLEHLKSIGCNTVSILPYSGFRSMSDPHPFRLNHGSGGENDAAVIRSAYKAKQLGFTVMLKPQIWSWMGWTGDITMKDEAQWDLFLEYYSEWILHYAMLAEIHGFDILCVGNEFKNATLTHQQKWETLFDRVRKVYSGKITYAANWGDEFEKVTFWDKLDYIGVNCYYPLSPKQDPSDDELMAQMEKNLEVIGAIQEKYQKPLLFTEIGFKSISYPWINPHLDDDEQAYNEAAQQRCYEVMFRAMQDEPWISGIYLWKWPTYMEYSNEYRKDFNPCNKQAEVVIKNWFAKY